VVSGSSTMVLPPEDVDLQGWSVTSRCEFSRCSRQLRARPLPGALFLLVELFGHPSRAATSPCLPP
jgi:hypothetical protein